MEKGVIMSSQFNLKEKYGIDDLLNIMELLRSEQGCPWDREQTHESIRRNFLEEAYEAADAIDLGDTASLCEELGDVLLQVVFHSKIAQEAGNFDFQAVCDGVCKKLIVRHPHIFADTAAGTAQEVLSNWEAIKLAGKEDKSAAGYLKSVPRAFPALLRADKVQARAAKTGFDYPSIDMALGDLESELSELRQAMREKDAGGCHEELGDLLFSVVNVARLLTIDSEKSLSDSCDKFISRFEQVEQLANERDIDMKSSDIEQLNALWREAKQLRSSL